MALRFSAAVAFCCSVLLASLASGQPLDATAKLIQWVVDLGGTVNAVVKTNGEGFRGLFATRDIKEGEDVLAVPAAAIINAGGLKDSFAVPTMTVLRELKDPHSRFKPYVDVFPSPSEVLNSCNMDRKYIPMWKSEYWEKNVAEWLDYLDALLLGKLNPDIEVTIQEAVGNATVTIQDLQYACAISSTRYVSATRRKRLIMVPVYDMANHKLECPHHINEYEASDFFRLIAGADVKEGEEICYSYGTLRDDYALSHYGFLPDVEDPPRLALVDHPDFKPEAQYDHDDAPGEEEFDGTPEESAAELARLKAIYDKLKATPDLLPPQPPGQDYTYDMLKELERRRLVSLAYEITRLSEVLELKVEL